MTRKEKSLKEEQQLLENEVNGMVDGEGDVAQGGFERIVLEHGVGYDQGNKVAFKGTKIYTYGNHEAFATSGGKILIYSEFGCDGAAYKIFATPEEAAEEEDSDGETYYPTELLSAIAHHFGKEYVEELDI